MIRPPSRARIVALLAVPVVALTGLLAVSTTPAQAATCNDVEVVFARGTGETPGLGILGRPLVTGLESELSGYSIAASCPGTRFVIRGYSQGGPVTDVTIGIRTGVSTGTPIPTNLSGRVAAVVVFGNPLGASGRTISTASTLYRPKSRGYCDVSDSICGGAGRIGPARAPGVTSATRATGP